MDVTFTSLMETIRLLGGRTDRTKEETLAYYAFLRYAASLARLNTDVVDAEIYRRSNEEFQDGQAEGHPSNSS